MTIVRRLAGLDWDAVARDLDELGWAMTPPVLSADECAHLKALYEDERSFRSTVDMARHRFGEGQYRYFADPLPALVGELRQHVYPRLAPTANAWAKAMGATDGFPLRLPEFQKRCRARGQTRPTPLLLRYGPGGYNRLHRDLYGDVAFPIQLTAFLSEPGVDYDGGAFLLVEQRPRQQSRGEALLPARGSLVVFATAERPVRGPRGYGRAGMRHGVSRITRGERYALGVPFHDAR